jgi:hypothetical protein
MISKIINKDMKDIKVIANEKAMVLTIILMVVFMKANGVTISRMVMVVSGERNICKIIHKQIM